MYELGILIDKKDAFNNMDGVTHLKLRRKYYTPSQLANLVNVSRQTVVKWINDGQLDAERTPGGHYRIPSSVIVNGDDTVMIPLVGAAND